MKPQPASRDAFPAAARSLVAGASLGLAFGRRRLLALFLALLAGFGSPAASASGAVAVFASGQGEAYAEVIAALSTELGKAPGTRIVVGASGADRVEDMLANAGQTASGSGLLIVTIGANATRLVLEHADLRTPVLAVLVPRVTFEALQRGARSPHGRRASAVFLDQPLARQFDLLRIALPKAQRVGAIAPPTSSDAFLLQP